VGSRSRLPLVKPGDSDEAGRQATTAAAANFAGIQNMRAAVDRYGYRGDIAQAASPLGSAFMQFVILATAREHDQPYKWSLHEIFQFCTVTVSDLVDGIMRVTEVRRYDLQGQPPARAAIRPRANRRTPARSSRPACPGTSSRFAGIPSKFSSLSPCRPAYWPGADGAKRRGSKPAKTRT
jgi:hypothetical protein